MLIADAIEKMTAFYNGNLHDIHHFLKVWAWAKTIGEKEKLDAHTLEVLELAAVVHDIACPLCREKYGNTNGKNQERESPPLIGGIFPGFARPPLRCRTHFMAGGAPPYLYRHRRTGLSDLAGGGFSGQRRGKRV